MRERRVLGIEHEWRLRKMIRANLEALGVKVLSAVNGRQGLELIHGAQPDLIVADLDGLKMDGVHLVKGACRNG